MFSVQLLLSVFQNKDTIDHGEITMIFGDILFS